MKTASVVAFTYINGEVTLLNVGGDSARDFFVNILDKYLGDKYGGLNFEINFRISDDSVAVIESKLPAIKQDSFLKNYFEHIYSIFYFKSYSVKWLGKLNEFCPMDSLACMQDSTETFACHVEEKRYDRLPGIVEDIEETILYLSEKYNTKSLLDIASPYHYVLSILDYLDSLEEDINLLFEKSDRYITDELLIYVKEYDEIVSKVSDILLPDNRFIKSLSKFDRKLIDLDHNPENDLSIEEIEYHFMFLGNNIKVQDVFSNYSPVTINDYFHDVSYVGPLVMPGMEDLPELQFKIMVNKNYVSFVEDAGEEGNKWEIDEGLTSPEIKEEQGVYDITSFLIEWTWHMETDFKTWKK